MLARCLNTHTLTHTHNFRVCLNSGAFFRWFFSCCHLPAHAASRPLANEPADLWRSRGLRWLTRSIAVLPPRLPLPSHRYSHCRSMQNVDVSTPTYMFIQLHVSAAYCVQRRHDYEIGNHTMMTHCYHTHCALSCAVPMPRGEQCVEACM